MATHSPDQKSLQNIKNLQALFVSKQIPSSGSISLTHRCNLQCVHCYLGSRNSSLRSPETELNTRQWLDIIDQITEAGCLNLLISGGDPLVRHDFADIYHKAVTNGILVTVFSNGTLFTPDILYLFEDLPPQSIEISVYGATPGTYERITGSGDGFAKCMEGIRQLSGRGIRFKLKTMLLNQNISELEKIRSIAEEFGVHFRMDPAITAGLDGNRTPLESRVDPAEAAEADLFDPDRKQRYKDYYEKHKTNPRNDFLFTCGAGLTNFHIDPDGNLLPCMMLNKPVVDLRSRRFIDGWKNEIISLRNIKANEKFKCNTCDKRGICSGCPAYFELESGSPQSHSEYICEIAQRRFEAIHKN